MSVVLVKLYFRMRDDFDWVDEDIQALLDSGMGVHGAAVFICDAYMARYTTDSEVIKVGPITIDSSSAYKAWDALKMDMLRRWNLGIGIPGMSAGGNGSLAMGGATMSGTGPDQFWVGQLDNPPEP